MTQTAFDHGHVIALKKGAKTPSGKSWRKLSKSDEWDGNIALHLGDSSLLDVDVDNDVARDMMDQILPQTGLRWPGHHIYSSQDTVHQQYMWRGKPIVELRGGNRYAMCPPSIHPDGHTLQWDSCDTPSPMTAERLAPFCALLAAYASLVEVWRDIQGNRHRLALGAGAFLARATTFSPASIAEIIHTAASVAGDSEKTDRLRAAHESAEKERAGKRVTIKPLWDSLGAEGSSAWRTWFGVSAETAPNARDRRRDQYAEPQILRQLEEMNEKHYYLSSRSTRPVAMMLGDQTVFLSASSFKDTYLNQRCDKSTLGELWLEWPDRRQYDNVDYYFGETPERCLNLWQGFVVEPCSYPEYEETVDRFLEHIHTICCSGDRKVSSYIINLLAWKVQNPGGLARSIPALVGGQGTGKSIVFDEYAALFGDHATTIRDHELFSNFNSWANSLVVRADEVTSPRHRAQAAQSLKLLTESNIALVKKGVDAVRRPNRMLILVTTNDSSFARLDGDDRRLVMPDVSSARRNDYAYFSSMVGHGYGEPPNPKFQATLLQRFLSMSIDMESVNYRPPMTTTKEDQIEESLGVVEMYLRDLAETGSLPLVAADGIGIAYTTCWERWFTNQEIYRGFQAVTGTRDRYTQHYFTRRLNGLAKKAGGETKVKRVKGTGSTMRCLFFPDRAPFREAWTNRYGKYEWENESLVE